MKFHLSAKGLITAVMIASTAPMVLPAPVIAVQAQQGQMLNYRDADIRVFIEDMALANNVTFIIDPMVTGKVNLVTQKPLSGDALFLTFLSVLKVNGFTALKSADGTYKIVKDTKALTSANTQTGAQGDIFVTRVLTVNHVDPRAVRDALKPYIHKAGNIYARPDLPIVIISDYAQNMQRLTGLLADIDIDKTEMRTLRLQHTSVSEMAEVANRLSSQVGGDDSLSKPLRAIEVKGSNSLILKGLPKVLDQYIPILKAIDQDNASRGDVKVLHLKYANAQKILPMLQSVASAIVTKDATGKAVGGGQGVTISAYDGTNAVIIAAGADMQARIAQVVTQLDVPRPQVQVEAIIVEVSEDATKELGLQYVLAGGDGSGIPFTVQNYSRTAPNILAATGAVVVDGASGDGSSSASDILQAAAVDSLLGLNGFGLGAAGRTSNGGVFGVILNALQSDSDSNILSTPSITTLNNEPAEFMSGQEIPITTGETLGSNNNNPFRTIERKRVGIKLEVTPQINEQGDIRMVIAQEVSALAGTTATGEIITNQRQLKTTVRVPDGEILVLGGLIQDNERITIDKVPLLGDIPVLGNAFKSKSRTREKRNLMIFLRPTILKSGADIKRATDKKLNYMRARQQMSGSKLDVDAMMRDVLNTGGSND